MANTSLMGNLAGKEEISLISQTKHFRIIFLQKFQCVVQPNINIKHQNPLTKNIIHTFFDQCKKGSKQVFHAFLYCERGIKVNEYDQLLDRERGIDGHLWKQARHFAYRGRDRQRYFLRWSSYIEKTKLSYRYLFLFNFTQTLTLLVTVTSLLFQLLVTILKCYKFNKERSFFFGIQCYIRTNLRILVWTD